MFYLLDSYNTVEDLPEVDISKAGKHSFMVQHAEGADFGPFLVEVSYLLYVRGCRAGYLVQWQCQ